VIANRTASRAADLAEIFRADGPVAGGGFAALADERAFYIIINGSSASIAGEMPPLPHNVVGAGTRCYDMMYGRQETVFLRWAREHGAVACADGLGMLVEQAAEAFFIWRGKHPDTAPVLAALRAQ